MECDLVVDLMFSQKVHHKHLTLEISRNTELSVFSWLHHPWSFQSHPEENNVPTWLPMHSWAL